MGTGITGGMPEGGIRRLSWSDFFDFGKYFFCEMNLYKSGYAVNVLP